MLYRGADLIRDIEWVIFDEVSDGNILYRVELRTYERLPWRFLPKCRCTM
jgi:hypothetical protein